MQPAERSITLHGGCHCGALRIEFRTRLPVADIAPRACDCTFCQKHGAAYVSDPAGELRIFVPEPEALRSCRQGSEAALFRLCSRCGVLVAVTFEHDNRLFAAVNARCLDEWAGLASSVPVSPRLLSPEEKKSRWVQLWIPDVELVPGVPPIA
ncbi:aldehyde-activating protein [Rhodanobacter sp. B05]|uniref:GFA family protein n=1 Tax=Rhodanobacter sp. B05 TaxID=1945859 RepID=UPI00098443F1|nr:aldehyde-activating protein [Rhodanobacter sp. B05]OOG59110.1 aldehyde-activating protein [Rhodanobacter sp. B05]